jgi:hypothetical protein
LVAPVAASNRLLDAKLQSLERLADLGDVSDAAEQLTRDLTLAQGGLAVLEAHGDDVQAKALLEQALTANIHYAGKVKAASAGLDAARASAAARAADQAARSYSAAGTAAPKLALPRAGLFLSAGLLQTFASEQAQTQATSSAALRSYAQAIDSLLRNSAVTRSDLRSLIGDVRRNRLSASQAASQIASVINQRRELSNQVSAAATPPQFRSASIKLVNSINAALDDDYAIQAWINARYGGDSYAVRRAFSRHQAATARASAAKADFLGLYNLLRGRFLGLRPISVSY